MLRNTREHGFSMQLCLFKCPEGSSGCTKILSVASDGLVSVYSFTLANFSAYAHVWRIKIIKLDLTFPPRGSHSKQIITGPQRRFLHCRALT